MDEIVDVMLPKSFNTGEALMRQGEDGDLFYIIEEGSCDILVSKDGVTETVMECRAGDSVGEMALMYNGPRAATVHPSAYVKAWALDRMSFKVRAALPDVGAAAR